MTARAVVMKSFDSGARLMDVPVPEVGPGQARIRLHAASLNAFDWKVAAGVFKDMFTYRFPVTIGRDYAGVVERVGDGVTRVREGDAVFGYLGSQELHRGSLADYLCVAENECFVAKPEGLSFEQAASLPLAAVVARRCVEAVGAGSGVRLLILGAPGAVGSYAVQMAASIGAEVIASGPPQDREYLTALGAADTVDPAGDVLEAVRRRYPGGLQGLIDLVSYRPDFLRYAELLIEGGRAASTHRAADPAALGERSITGVNVTSQPDSDLLADIGAAAAAGEFSIPLGSVLPLEDACEGLRRLREGHSRGKVAVNITDGKGA